jgi:hypothetical protein
LATDRESLLYRLNVDLQTLGLQYRGNDPEELGRILQQAQAERSDKPACFARSFDPRSILCQRCDLWDDCGKLTIPVERNPKECDLCDGDLLIALYDDSGTIRDYGCSTPGCRNTERLQRRQKEQATK